MNQPIQTEEEFKKLLRSLAHKGQDDRSDVQKKFFSKLSEASESQDLHTLKNQLEKVRPAIKKLMEDLKEARDEIEELKNTTIPLVNKQELEEELKKEREEKSILVLHLEEMKKIVLQQENEKQGLHEEIYSLKSELAQLDPSLFQNEIARVEADSLHARQAFEELKNTLERNEEELLRRKEFEAKEFKRYEEERQKLVEKLADSLSQHQRQNEIIQDLREETALLKREFEQSEERWKRADKEIEEAKGRLSQSLLDASRLHTALERQLQDERHKKEEFKQQLIHTQEELQKAQLGSLNSGLEQQLADLQEVFRKVQVEHEALQGQLVQAEENFKKQLAKKESAFEEILARGYSKMKEFSQRHALMGEDISSLENALKEKTHLLEELEGELRGMRNECQNLKIQNEDKESEIRKAQQHLAKKVKESTILQDLLERQKMQTLEVQKNATQHKGEVERLQSLINTQRIQEEKAQVIAKERIQEAEALAKEWQEKYVSLHQESQDLKSQLLELRKVKKQYDQLSSSVASLKQFFGKHFDASGWEGEERKGKSSSVQDDFFD